MWRDSGRRALLAALDLLAQHVLVQFEHVYHSELIILLLLLLLLFSNVMILSVFVVHSLLALEHNSLMILVFMFIAFLK